MSERGVLPASRNQTIRELWEGVRDRHSNTFPAFDRVYCCVCERKCPCPDYVDAVAALALLPDDEIQPPEDLNVTVPCVRGKRLGHEWREYDWDEGVAVCKHCGLNASSEGLLPDPGVGAEHAPKEHP